MTAPQPGPSVNGVQVSALGAGPEHLGLGGPTTNEAQTPAETPATERAGNRSGSAPSAVLAAERLAFRWPGPGGRGVFEQPGGLTAAFPAGSVTAVMGPNGCGKSTLLRLLLGLIVPTNGKIALAGTPLRELRRRERAARLAWVPQRPSVAFGYTARRVVELGRYAADRSGTPGRDGRDGRGSPSSLGPPSLTDSPGEPAPGHRGGAAERALALVGAADLADRRFDRLSVGQQQRVAIARALAQLGAGWLDTPSASTEPDALSGPDGLWHRRQLTPQPPTPRPADRLARPPSASEPVSGPGSRSAAPPNPAPPPPAGWASGSAASGSPGPPGAPSSAPAPLGRWLLADEPLSALDPRHARAAVGVFRELAAWAGVGVVLVLHDPVHAAMAADRLLLLGRGGSVVADGPCAEHLRPEPFAEAFETPFVQADLAGRAVPIAAMPAAAAEARAAAGADARAGA